MTNDELDALNSLRDYQERTASSGSFLVCECECISNTDIKNYLVSKNINVVDLDMLKKDLKLGSGCTSCIKSFDAWSKKIFLD
jgi:bacterioferritin-associated ferredoxin